MEPLPGAATTTALPRFDRAPPTGHNQASPITVDTGPGSAEGGTVAGMPLTIRSCSRLESSHDLLVLFIEDLKQPSSRGLFNRELLVHSLQKLREEILQRLNEETRMQMED